MQIYGIFSCRKSKFQSQINGIQWRNNEEEFKSGERETGYPFVDAGMRELIVRFMHNRVRMITAIFYVNIYH